MNQKLLLVDDDPDILSLLTTYLQRNAFQVICATQGQQALDLAKQHPDLDLMVLDLMLPDLDGFQVCQRLRQYSTLPILMLTANEDATDRIVGLEMGADDYLSKPFNPRELLARIKAILRRSQPTNQEESSRYYFAGFRLDGLQRQLLSAEGQVLDLTGAEFTLLQLFVQHPGRVLERSQLAEATTGRDLGPLDRNLDVQISRLRTKLQDDGKQPRLIKTIRGLGYLFCAEVRKDEP